MVARRKSLIRRIERLESSDSPRRKAIPLYNELKQFIDARSLDSDIFDRIMHICHLKGGDPNEYAATDPGRIEIDLLLEPARRIREENSISGGHARNTRLTSLNFDEMQEQIAIAEDARARDIQDITQDPFLHAAMEDVFVRAEERRQGGHTEPMPVENATPTLLTEARELLGCHHWTMHRFWPSFDKLNGEELERLVNYLTREIDVWPDRDWSTWPPFLHIKAEEVREHLQSFPRHNGADERRINPLTDSELSDAEMIATKIRLGVHSATWRKLSRLSAGSLFFNTFSHHFSGLPNPSYDEKSQLSYTTDKYPRARPNCEAIIIGGE